LPSSQISDGEPYHLWPQFDQDDVSSPRQIEHFPWQARRVSVISGKSSSYFSTSDSSNQMPSKDQVVKPSLGCSDGDTGASIFSLRTMSSPCKLQPSKAQSWQSLPSVHEITEALSRI
jgi:hypothetical protein